MNQPSEPTERTGPGLDWDALLAARPRADAYEIVTSHLEIAWIEAARAVCETRCPASLHW